MSIRTFSLTLNLQSEGNSNTGTLVIEGEITVQNATEIKTLLLDALEKTDTCFIDLQQITQIDLSGIQLLYAAKNYATNSNKDFKITGDCPVHMLETIKESGFKNIDWLT